MANFVNLMDVIYPIGSIYVTTSASSPSSIVGGTWSKIDNAFLYCNNSNSGYVGSNLVTLNLDHNHFQSLAFPTGKVTYSTNQTGIGWHEGNASIPVKPILTADSNYNRTTDSSFWGQDSAKQAQKRLGNVTFDNKPHSLTCYGYTRTA